MRSEKVLKREGQTDHYRSLLFAHTKALVFPLVSVSSASVVTFYHLQALHQIVNQIGVKVIDSMKEEKSVVNS